MDVHVHARCAKEKKADRKADESAQKYRPFGENENEIFSSAGVSQNICEAHRPEHRRQDDRQKYRAGGNSPFFSFDSFVVKH